MSGLFITMEGGEGSGKSTALEHVERTLSQIHGKPVVRTREPGGTPLGESVRGLVLSPDTGAVCEDAELLLMFAARAQHLAHVVRPALARGEWVLCDRFTDSTYAYQGYGRGMSLATIEVLETTVQGTLRPDAVLYLDCQPEIGLARAARRGEADRIERETLAFHERVRAGYLALAKASDNYHVIDASQPIESVLDSISAVLAQLVTAHAA